MDPVPLVAVYCGHAESISRLARLTTFADCETWRRGQPDNDDLTTKAGRQVAAFKEIFDCLELIRNEYSETWGSSTDATDTYSKAKAGLHSEFPDEGKGICDRIDAFLRLMAKEAVKCEKHDVIGEVHEPPVGSVNDEDPYQSDPETVLVFGLPSDSESEGGITTQPPSPRSTDRCSMM